MITITTTSALQDFCTRAAAHDFVTVDTEFLRERTYYAQLCLIQLAVPGEAEEDAVLVDTMAEGLDLAPLHALFADPSVVKVFHAARQDLEIFYHLSGAIPAPLFDTQVAAMVCGFGEQVGYETLVRKICNAGLDKSSRFTDWSRRPLSDKQQAYALADVTHLRDIYLHLSRQLHESGRAGWLEEELAILTSPDTYVTLPQDAWKRVKTRSNSPRFLAVVRALAELREHLAQTRNVPRSRIFKDDVILELAATRPTQAEDLAKSRLLQREARKGDVAEAILAAVNAAMALPKDALPQVEEIRERRQGQESLADLLRVMLKAKAEETGVAQKLIATSSDLDDIAAGADEGCPVLRGWRRDVFGEDAIRLREGRIALSANGEKIRIVEL
ncbi:ribonuclease D [Halovulum dunhuangense]|uniref:Ribonuclease D n=1 Tax=Halovulum dunhuangense TaxID=1505036 RepID=A0A849L323_9RHOB|nr:ribonuclease D [Halovulum dunhuangense]NNU80607.1 ribonuclease D [Halovulum dunhuangense]